MERSYTFGEWADLNTAPVFGLKSPFLLQSVPDVNLRDLFWRVNTAGIERRKFSFNNLSIPPWIFAQFKRLEDNSESL